MDNIINKLKELSIKYPIESQFDWEIPDNCPINIPNSINDKFAKNIYLKDNLWKLLQNDNTLIDHYWVIREWGGIKSFKQNERNDKKIKKFKEQLNDGNLTRETFNLISSLSKIASFIKPKEYAIYDSRVIYSLNWLIFLYSKEKQFFPQPFGRNSSLAKYDMQTLFNLSEIGYEYKSHKLAFFEYCQLISKLSKAVYGNNSMPYKVEMLLFVIAVEYVVDNIEKSISININKNRKFNDVFQSIV